VKIGELSKRTGTPKETIHHYIREGLLRKPRKIKGNMANYSEGHVESLLIIKELRDHYYMPLPEIKKYLVMAKKRLTREFPAHQIQKMMNQFLKHVELLFPPKVTGRMSFIGVTGLADELLNQLEEWAVIDPEVSNGERVYSNQDVIVGRLVSEFVRLGFGPESGTDPVNLKRVVDFFREELLRRQQEILTFKYGKEPLNAEQLLQAAMFGDLMSLVILYLFRRLDDEGFKKFLTSVGETSVGR
jgi:DNA-binding transcriptional MerR regulator